LNNKTESAKKLLEYAKKNLEKDSNSRKAKKIYNDFINSKAFFGKTALIIAAELGFKEMVEVLLGYGADPSIKRWIFGKDAAGFAEKNGHTKLAERIKEYVNSEPKAASIVASTYQYMQDVERLEKLEDSQDQISDYPS